MTRYGNQPISEVRNLTERELGMYQAALSRLVTRENEPKREE